MDGLNNIKKLLQATYKSVTKILTINTFICVNLFGSNEDVNRNHYIAFQVYQGV